MKPDWLRCSTCLFSTNDLPDNEEPVVVCNVTNKPEPKYLYNFCKEWVCENCWEGWESCTYPKDEDDFRGIYEDHDSCEPVRFKGA